jgi:small subunit ribosomal protein S8
MVIKMVTDPIADMLTRIRNAIMARHKSLIIPCSKVKTRIAEILKEEGYIKDFHIKPYKRQGNLVIFLRYHGQKNVIDGLKRISKPGCRIYARKDRLFSSRSGLGITIVSTSQGIMTDREARRRNLGGEVLCAIW